MNEDGIPEANRPVDCRQTHCELIDLSEGSVWQSTLPMDHATYKAMELPPGYARVGIGAGVMDAHYFRRSPGADTDGPVRERAIAGHAFFHCANPPKDGPESPVGDDPKLLRVDKHHTLIFEAGREVDVIRCDAGRDYVQVITASPRGDGIMQKTPKDGTTPAALPKGWTRRTERIEARTSIHLPHPTKAWFFASGESFQGPVDTFGAPVAD